MKKAKVIFKPSVKSIAFGVIGTAFFGVLSFNMLNLEWIVSEGTNEIIGYSILCIMTLILLFFTLSTFFWLINTKIIELRTNEIRIVKPLIFLHRSILLRILKGFIKEITRSNRLIRVN